MGRQMVETDRTVWRCAASEERNGGGQGSRHTEGLELPGARNFLVTSGLKEGKESDS
jgi:hypothetical protein